MKNPLIFAQDLFLGKWMKSKVKEFENLSDQEKLLHLDKLMQEIDHDKLKDSAWSDYVESIKNIRNALVNASKENHQKILSHYEILQDLFFEVEKNRSKYNELKNMKF